MVVITGPVTIAGQPVSLISPTLPATVPAAFIPSETTLSTTSQNTPMTASSDNLSSPSSTTSLSSASSVCSVESMGPVSLVTPMPHPPSTIILTSNCSSNIPITTVSPVPFTFQSSAPLLPCNPLILTPASWKQQYGMEQVWVKEFNTLFVNFLPHIWCIQPVETKPIGGNSLCTFVDSAKVRFCCDVCGHGWTSMKGRVAFWFDLAYIYGIVAFKLYGQQCDRCRAQCKTERYEQPMWYPEEVTKVLVNLYNRVGQTFYGFYCSPIERTRRAGKPRTPHNSILCQACKDGLCADRK